MPNNYTPQNKIKGDYAELICKHHFELMGCHVNKVGIEDLSPSFAKLQSTHNAVQALKSRMQLMPDFLVVHPSMENASFVEVKYRKDITDDTSQLREFSKYLHKRYENFIKDGVPVYFYLLTNKKPYVHIMKANALKHWEETGGFYPVGVSALDNLPFFRGTKQHSSFNTIYETEIMPAIEDIICKEK